MSQPLDPIDRSSDSDLEELTRLTNPVDVSVLQALLEDHGIRSVTGGEAASGWYWHATPALGGVRVYVKNSDLSKAQQVIQDFAPVPMPQEDESDETDEDTQTQELRRAWRMSIIGFCFFPPLLNLYSSWILFRNDFFPKVASRSRWMVKGTLAANFLVMIYIGSIAWFITASLIPSHDTSIEFFPPTQQAPWTNQDGNAPPGEPIEPVYETRTRTYYILP